MLKNLLNLVPNIEMKFKIQSLLENHLTGNIKYTYYNSRYRSNIIQNLNKGVLIMLLDLLN